MRDTDPEFEWTFRSEYQTVLRTVFFIVNDHPGAEDITQEDFIQLLAHWKKVSRYDRPGAWVRRVAIRLAVRTAKRDKARAQTEESIGRQDVSLPDVDLERAVSALQ